MDTDLKQVLDAVIASQNDLRAAVEVRKRRDVWDKLGTLSGFFSALLVALIGFLTVQNNAQHAHEEQTQRSNETDRAMAQKIVEDRLLQVQTIEKFIPHAGTSEDRQKIALVAMRYLGNDAFYAELTKLGLTRAIRDTAAAVAASGTSSPVAQPAAAAPAGKGWIFLGTYHSQTAQWETRYLDFPVNALPRSLENKELRVWEQTGALNVRGGLPDSRGLLPQVVTTLPEGQRVTPQKVQRWGGSDLYFGLVPLR
jgi:hypothetical protein